MRLIHWGFAVAFLGLLGSGLAVGNPDLRGIPFLGSKLFREIHLTWAVLLFVLPALAAAWDGFSPIADLWREARAARGRFNAGQKLNLALVVILTTGLVVTGTVIGAPVDGPLPAGVREAIYPLHTLLGYCTIPVVVGHVLVATWRGWGH
jgi:cytochrome b subunit of formate dehydrogenase